MSTLPFALERKIGSTLIQKNTRVLGLSQTGREWVLNLSSGESFIADHLAIALPAHESARLLEKISPPLSGVLNQIQYTSSTTIQFAYHRGQIRHPIDGMGLVIPEVENRSLSACSFSSQKFFGRAPEGSVLLRAFLGGAHHEPDVDRVTRDLSELLQIDGKPLFTKVSRWAKSMAQYTLGHLNRWERIQSEVRQSPGLTLTGNGYTGIGIPDVIARSEEVATEIFTAISSKTKPQESVSVQTRL